VLATEWPEFRELDFAGLVPRMKRAVLIDQNAFAAKQVIDIPGLEYIVAGRVQ
jgi:UDPglucose 6-dehydrogenase